MDLVVKGSGEAVFLTACAGTGFSRFAFHFTGIASILPQLLPQMQLFNNDIRIERQRFQFTYVALAPANGYAQKNSAERFSALKYGSMKYGNVVLTIRNFGELCFKFLHFSRV